jgi:hypothetical protein
MAKVTKWVHLNESGGDPWVLPIWTAANTAREAGKVGEITDAMSELAVHVSTRLNAIPRAIKRLRESESRLLEAAKRHENRHVFTDQTEGATLDVDADLKYCAILDVDSLLFEMNSCAELMTNFFGLLQAHAGKPVEDAKLTSQLRRIFKEQGVDATWFKELDQARNFVAHEGCAYLAVDVSGEPPELLIPKANVHSFEDPSTYLRFAQLGEMVDGFYKARDALQKHLIELYKAL